MKRIAINYMFISIFIFCLILIDSYGISPDLNTAEISIQLKDKFIEKHKTFNLYLSQTIVNGITKMVLIGCLVLTVVDYS